MLGIRDAEEVEEIALKLPIGDGSDVGLRSDIVRDTVEMILRSYKGKDSATSAIRIDANLDRLWR
ncbi:hypothetical protein KIN20_020065 [Parelaphostrongylus tenuis]|uniref:Uncharacterized protein n=1 Tax=Parelaphostrongylus tenuis TaxID=148309 RepID=A0AAD5MQI8_PARTN|nr:hypothetical protein KIN20_020065 [Parelaphostrongylus tenuis]